ncbi:MAG: hypothetical protein M1114_05425 [Candidatus Dependentiae bacterium]|nr:hypothetical protein [Candidatus Dependentiae bacterium]
MKLAHSSYLIFVLFLFCTTSLEAHRRTPFVWPTGSYQESKDGITISSRILSEQETAELFDGYGKNLIQGRRSTIPHRLQIINSTEKEIVLKDADIGLTLVDPMSQLQNSSWFKNIAKNFGITAGTMGGIAVGSHIALLGLGAFFASYGPVVGPIVAMGCLTLMPGPIFVIVGVGAASGGFVGYKASDYLVNTAIPADQLEHISVSPKSIMGMHEALMIKPGETKECLFFTMMRDIKPTFNVSISSVDNNKTTFTISNATTETAHWNAIRVI